MKVLSQLNQMHQSTHDMTFSTSRASAGPSMHLVLSLVTTGLCGGAHAFSAKVQTLMMYTRVIKGSMMYSPAISAKKDL